MVRDNTNKGFWEKFAKIYTAFMMKNNIAYDKICDRLKAYLDNEKCVLELACGTGQITFRLAAESQLWEATDYSENMIQEAERRNVGEKKCEKIIFSVQDATNLTYEEESFDIVIIANALHIMPEPDRALKEIHRVLKREGILFAPTFVYEKGYSKPLIWLMEQIGFKTYFKWKKNEFAEFVRKRDFQIVDTALIKGKPLSECVLVGKKI